MARYPEVRSASIPALWAVQRHYGWCTPDGIRQAAAVMGVTPAYLESVASFYDLFRLDARRARTGCSSAPTSPAGCAAATSCWRRSARRRDATPTRPTTAARARPTASSSSQGFECLGACDLAPMASIDERYYGPLDRRRRPRPRSTQLRAGAEVAPRQGAAQAPAAGGAEPSPTPRQADRSGPGGPGVERGGCRPMSRETRVLFRHIDEPGLRSIDELPAAAAAISALERAFKEIEPEELLTSSRTPACAAAAAPASRWARRARSCRAATWRSTSAATPTSRSPGRSRTAS